MAKMNTSEYEYSLSYGYPSCHHAARAGKLLASAAQHLAASEDGISGKAFLYGEPQGSIAYREELAKLLSTNYGEPVSSESLQVTAGATHGLQVTTSLFLKSTDIVFIEDPSYFVIFDYFRKELGVTLVQVRTDGDGMDLDHLEQLVEEYCSGMALGQRRFRAMVYTIPTFHNPTGRCMAEDRCRRLVDLAHKHDLLVFCDDVYNLLHYTADHAQRRLLSYEKEMYGDVRGNVISNGTFSKILTPAIRVGWIESCKDIITYFAGSKLAFSGGSFNHYGSQLITHILQTGQQQALLEQVRAEFQSRLKAVNEVLHQRLPRTVNYISPQGGFFFWLVLPVGTDMNAVKNAADKRKVNFIHGKQCSSIGTHENCIRFSISYYREPELVKALELLCEAICTVVT